MTEEEYSDVLRSALRRFACRPQVNITYIGTPLGENWVCKYLHNEVQKEREPETGFIRESFIEFGKHRVRRVPVFHG